MQMGLQEKGGWNMTSIRHWLNLKRGPDPLTAASAAWVLLPCSPSLLLYHPQVPPIGASALASEESRS